MIAVGVILAWLLLEYRAKKRQMDTDFLFSATIWILIGGLGGAKLLFWIMNIREIVRNPHFLLETIADGFVVYGGIVLGIITLWVICRLYRRSFLQTFDMVMPCVALAQAFGRLGCFMAGCCYGKETHWFPYVVFHSSYYAPNGVKLIPTQLISCALNLCNMAVLLHLSKKQKFDGQIAAAYLINYSIGRFFVEFLRGDPERGFIGVFSTSQVLAFAGLLAGGGMYMLSKHRMAVREK